MEALDLQIPLQRSAQPTPAVSSYERGTAGAKWVHAIRKTLNGDRALCNPGLPVHRIGGRYDPSETDACLDCAAVKTITL